MSAARLWAMHGKHRWFRRPSLCAPFQSVPFVIAGFKPGTGCDTRREYTAQIKELRSSFSHCLLASAKVPKTKGKEQRGAERKRIQKVEKDIFKLEASIQTIDEEMNRRGFEVDALLKLQTKRDAVSVRVETFMSEWEELQVYRGASMETSGPNAHVKSRLCAGDHEGQQALKSGMEGAKRKKNSAGAPVKPATGGKVGRVVLNHSTHIPRLIEVLSRLVDVQGVFTMVPGQLSR